MCVMYSGRYFFTVFYIYISFNFYLTLKIARTPKSKCEQTQNDKIKKKEENTQ